jgi:tyrosyl-tRNA synthetase
MLPAAPCWLAACLQVDSEGRKFGKSTGGAIWLSGEKLSPYKFYQYLFQVRGQNLVQDLLRLDQEVSYQCRIDESTMDSDRFRLRVGPVCCSTGNGR